MAFYLRRGRPIGGEVRRLLDGQVEGAIASLLRGDGLVRSDSLRAARKHLKKARALLLLIDPHRGSDVTEAGRQFRHASRLLVGVADAVADLDTLDRLRAFDRSLPTVTLRTVHAWLEKQAATLDRHARFMRCRARAARLLAAQRVRIERWDFRTMDAEAIIDAIRRAHRTARRRRQRALAGLRSDDFHRWRRDVKNEWYLLRLVAERCGGRLVEMEGQLEALDGCLGRLHNVDVLFAHLMQNSPLSRSGTARLLRSLRSYRRFLEKSTRLLDGVLETRPAIVAARVARAWGSPAISSEAQSRLRSKAA